MPVIFESIGSTGLIKSEEGQGTFIFISQKNTLTVTTTGSYISSSRSSTKRILWWKGKL